MRYRNAIFAAQMILGMLPQSLVAQAGLVDKPEYQATKTVFLGSPEDWDFVYFDQTSHRVLVAHGSEVVVVDGTSGALLGRVLGFYGVHGVTAIPELGKGYAVSRDRHVVNSFNLKSLRVETAIPVGSAADSLVFEPVSKRVLVMDAEAPIATVIDAVSDAVVTTVQLGGTAEQAVADRTGRVFVNLAERRLVIRLDARTAKVEARWSIPSCKSPHGISMDYKLRRLFVSCLNSRLLVMDADNGRVVTSLPIGKGTDGTAFDAKRRRVFSSNGWDGTLSVIAQLGPDQYASLGDIPTVRFGRTMAIDPDSGRIYIAAADLEKIDPHPAKKWAQFVMKPGSVRLIFFDPVG